MDDPDDVLSFDFESGDAGPTNPAAITLPLIPSASSAPPAASTASAAAAAEVGGAATGHVGRERSFRQTVCRHWLRSLCMKNEDCKFLHQYDLSRMPICRLFRRGECNDKDCAFKHYVEDIKECDNYKYGFCPNGPHCPDRHVKLPGPPPPVEEVLQIIQQQQQQAQQTSQTPILSAATSLPQGISRYFIVKSCNHENLELSVQHGVWATTQRSNEAKLNEAFDSADNVILIFSVNRTQHFQGCAKMICRIGESVGGGNWKYDHGTSHYGQNFSLKWLKLCELSFRKTHHLRNPYNGNLLVKVSRDCQELEPSIGEQLASLLYLEPDGELMAVSIAAESKREEEKAKGVNPDIENENPDFVPLEDNEEEEEEESEEEEEEEEGYSQSVGVPAQGRGMGSSGIMWPPHMPTGRGARPFHGMHGFPPGMMGPNRLSYGMHGFPPGTFDMAPHGFGPYGPRFSGGFMRLPPASMFPGRPSQPGAMFGMMMGQGRGPFMGGMGVTGRPVGVSTLYPTHAVPSSHNINRDMEMAQRGPGNDQNDRLIVDHNKGQETPGSGHDDEMQNKQGSKAHPAKGTTSRNEESESEDETPRRSRHGKGKKKSGD